MEAFMSLDLFGKLGFGFAFVVFTLLMLLPARVVQKRHGYPAWVLIFGLIPYLGSYILLWAFATSEHTQPNEVNS